MPTPLRASLPVALFALAAACGDGPGEDGAAVSVPTWRAAQEPARVIGAAEGEAAFQFDGIAGVRRTAGGTLVVADRGSKEVRLFDAEGRHLRSMGRAGGGPGEFEGLGRIFLLPGDSIAAWDANAQRLTVFAPDGRLGRTESLSLPGAAAPVEAILEDGTLLARPGMDVAALISASEGERRLPVTHLVRAPGSAEWREVGPFPGREEVVFRTGPSVSSDRVLFGRDHVVGAGRRRWFTGESERFAVTVRSPAGDSVGVLTREHAPRPVTGEMIERAREDRLAATEESRRAMARMGRRVPAILVAPDLPHRATLPAFDRVIEDAEENVWVRHFHFPSDAPQRWSVFSPAGELVAEAETPAAVRVQQIGADWIVGVAEDELGVEVVEVYALSRSDSAR